MPKFNLELFKTIILNFAYIHSKTRKLGMFILFQQCHFVYPNKVNSPPIRQFPIFRHVTSHVSIIIRQDTRKPQDLLLSKNSFCSRLHPYATRNDSRPQMIPKIDLNTTRNDPRPQVIPKCFHTGPK